MKNKSKALLSLFFVLLSALAIYIAKDWQVEEVARFPLVAAILLFIFSLADLLVILFMPEKKRETAIDFQPTAGEEVEPSVAFKRTLGIFGWILSLGFLILFLSFNIALPLFVFLYVKVVGRYGWFFSLLMGAIAWVFFYGLFDRMLHLPFPNGLILDWVGISL